MRRVIDHSFKHVKRALVLLAGFLSQTSEIVQFKNGRISFLIVLIFESVNDFLEVFVMHFHEDFFFLRIQVPKLSTTWLDLLIVFELFTELNLLFDDHHPVRYVQIMQNKVDSANDGI